MEYVVIDRTGRAEFIGEFSECARYVLRNGVRSTTLIVQI